MYDVYQHTGPSSCLHGGLRVEVWGPRMGRSCCSWKGPGEERLGGEPRRASGWEQGLVGGFAPAGSGFEQHHTPSFSPSDPSQLAQRRESPPGCYPGTAELPGRLQPQQWDTFHLSSIPTLQHSHAGPGKRKSQTPAHGKGVE